MCLFAVSSVMSNIRRLQKLPNDTIFYMATYFNMNAKQESLNKTPYQNVITYLSTKTLSLTSLASNFFSPRFDLCQEALRCVLVFGNFSFSCYVIRAIYTKPQIYNRIKSLCEKKKTTTKKEYKRITIRVMRNINIY